MTNSFITNKTDIENSFTNYNTGVCAPYFTEPNFTPIGHVTYEQAFPLIHFIVNSQRSKWRLKAVPHIDFDDVKIMILTHIHLKWEKYDQSRPLGGWVAQTAKYQMINMIRNLYSSTARPCLQCPANMETKTGVLGSCSLFGTQCNDCPLFKKWSNSKKSIHDAKLPLPITDHFNEVFTMPDESFDLLRSLEKFNPKLKERLNEREWIVYQMHYLYKKTDEEIAAKLNLRGRRKDNKIDFRRIRQIQTQILIQARNIIKEFGYEEFM